MQAIVCDKYGGPEVLQYKTVAKPVPKDKEVLIKVHAASVNAADWHLLRASPAAVRLAFGLFKPKLRILGADVAGVVEACGSKVEGLKPGDEVFGDLSGGNLGAYAEYVCAKEGELALKPSNVSFEQAAASPLAGMTAWKSLNDVAQVKSGQKVLIVGASGGVGSLAVQIARHLGAQVTGVCHADKVEMLKAIGVENIIDYTKEDVVKQSVIYDVIIDTAAFRSAEIYSKILSDHGKYILCGGDNSALFSVMLKGRWMGKKTQTFTNVMSVANHPHLQIIRGLLETGALKPYIKDRFPLSKVADAITLLESRKVQGKVVINVVE
jgi:NADPH:quinone reductase-like Zn-dependent oxidoreductase